MVRLQSSQVHGKLKPSKMLKVNLGAAKYLHYLAVTSTNHLPAVKHGVISEYSENKELAQKFLDWASSEEQQNKLCKGFGEVLLTVAREAAAKDSNEITKAVIDTFATQFNTKHSEMAEVFECWKLNLRRSFQVNKSAKAAGHWRNLLTRELIKQAIEQKHGRQ